MDQELKKNRALIKENSFLRTCMESVEEEGKSLQLEMLSSEETEELLEHILRSAFKSQSMQKRLKESPDFNELCNLLLKSSSKRTTFN